MKTLIPLLLVILVCVIPAMSWRRIRVPRIPRIPPPRIPTRTIPWRPYPRTPMASRIGSSVSAGRIGKRSIDWNGKHYTVNLDQCYFDFYDLNNDGKLERGEMITIFGENEKAEELFEALDITTGDGLIDEEEFNVMAKRIIDGCQETVEEDAEEEEI